MKWKTVLLVVAGAGVAMQAIRPSLENPPLHTEPRWDSPRTAELARRACFDCHSNQSRYPAYSQLVPVRWLIAHHVSEAREELNFSVPGGEFDVASMAKEIKHGEMPTWDYQWMHPEARLSPQEKDSLIAGLRRTFAGNGGSKEGDH